MKKCLVFLPLLLWCASCGIEGFSPILDLKPPLYPTLQIVSNQIEVSFWALNNEDYFEGYRIFVAQDYNSALNGTGREISNRNQDSSKPTIYNIPLMTKATQFNYLVERNYNGDFFIISNTYYFYIKAASTEYYSINSKSSDIASIIYTTNL